MKEQCGVAAIASKSKASSYIYYCLRALQHRGQEAVGIAVFNKKIESYKGIGLAANVFDDKKIKSLKGKTGIGHTYYSIKLSKPENAQPTIIKTEVGEIALAHNGILVNAEKLRKQLKKKGHDFTLGCEEEVVGYLLADHLRSSGDLIKAIKSTLSEIQGSYSFTMMLNGRVFGIRDPLGIKPLCLGKFKDGHVIVSESVALDVIDANMIRDVYPGELVEINQDGFESHQLFNKKHRAHCFFEYTYFARADSEIDGRSVYETRKRIGWRLAKEHPVSADIVIPVPDSGRAHAFGFSLGSGIPLAEGLMKNRYVARTFIMPTQKLRDLTVREKVNPIKSEVEGKRVVLVDDSIVRGTTMKRIVNMVRNANAREVHVRIGTPPLISPCYLGIDMTTRDQFIAHKNTIEEIRKNLDADSLGYISVCGLLEALLFSKSDLCLGCVTEKYPIDIPPEKHRFQHTIQDYE
ncbi:MAG: amidophosphoribosyltransferase [Methanomassiliicoccales archaeon]|nr:MAG: amidophosphoribosyltransferase [Methanomassiliicoccales archaeon]